VEAGIYAKQDYNTWLRYLPHDLSASRPPRAQESWNQAISRPGHEPPDWRPRRDQLTIRTIRQPNRASAGNVDPQARALKTRATITLEYYTRGIGQISVSAYRRDFKDLIRSRTFLVPAGGSWNGEPLPATVSREDWEISTVDNVGKSHMPRSSFRPRAS
jgi:hypothetical protein